MREVKATDVVKFLMHHVIYHFDKPRRIIHDNSLQFASQGFT